MPVRKTAVAIPEELLVEVDRAAEERGESRSGYITRLLRLAVRARRDAEITRKLDQLFNDDQVHAEQARDARSLDELGSEWTDERW